jgi:predicted alpha/beta-hydrolase family hydrolase
MRTSFKWDSGQVSGVWHRPAGGATSGLVLGHGASYNMDARFLLDIADALASRGIAVVRFNFPYAEAGRRTPDPQPRLEACFRAVASAVREEIPRLFLGGKSMGGRIASHIVADGFPTRGLVFFGYPLHPPGKPDRLRDAYLKRISAPMLFLQGTQDNFATPKLLRRTVSSLRTAKLVEIEGGDHSFKVPGRAPVDVMAELIDAAAQFIAEHER